MTTQCEESRARRRTRTLQPKSAEEEKGAGAERGERVGRREESGDAEGILIQKSRKKREREEREEEKRAQGRKQSPSALLRTFSSLAVRYTHATTECAIMRMILSPDSACGLSFK